VYFWLKAIFVAQAIFGLVYVEKLFFRGEKVALGKKQKENKEI